MLSVKKLENSMLANIEVRNDPKAKVTLWSEQKSLVYYLTRYEAMSTKNSYISVNIKVDTTNPLLNKGKSYAMLGLVYNSPLAKTIIITSTAGLRQWSQYCADMNISSKIYVDLSVNLTSNSFKNTKVIICNLTYALLYGNTFYKIVDRCILDSQLPFISDAEKTIALMKSSYNISQCRIVYNLGLMTVCHSTLYMPAHIDQKHRKYNLKTRLINMVSGYSRITFQDQAQADTVSFDAFDGIMPYVTSEDYLKYETELEPDSEAYKHRKTLLDEKNCSICLDSGDSVESIVVSHCCGALVCGDCFKDTQNKCVICTKHFIRIIPEPGFSIKFYTKLSKCLKFYRNDKILVIGKQKSFNSTDSVADNALVNHIKIPFPHQMLINAWFEDKYVARDAIYIKISDDDQHLVTLTSIPYNNTSTKITWVIFMDLDDVLTPMHIYGMNHLILLPSLSDVEKLNLTKKYVTGSANMYHPISIHDIIHNV